MPIDCRLCCLHIVRCPRLYLAKARRIAIPAIISISPWLRGERAFHATMTYPNFRNSK